MAQDRLREAVSALAGELPVRVVLSALAEDTAEIAAILAQYGSRTLPPEMVTRLRALEGELRELARLCQVPPPSPKKNGKLRIDEIPLF